MHPWSFSNRYTTVLYISKSCPLLLCMRNVAAGILLSLLLSIFVCFLTVCFWRNKDAYELYDDDNDDDDDVCLSGNSALW